jgi:hypothetical protein
VIVRRPIDKIQVAMRADDRWQDIAYTPELAKVAALFD